MPKKPFPITWTIATAGMFASMAKDTSWEASRREARKGIAVFRNRFDTRNQGFPGIVVQKETEIE